MALVSSITSTILPPIASLSFLAIASSLRGVSFPRYYWHLCGVGAGISGMVLSAKTRDELADHQSSKIARDEVFDIRLRGAVQNELYQINIPLLQPAIPQYQVIDPNQYQYQQQEQPQENSIYYNWDNLPDDAVGIILVGNSGSGKTSSACKVAEILTRNKPAKVIALDPHFNDVWGLVGIESIGKIEEIESAIIWLIEELDRRCERKGNKQPLGEDYIIFVDEINSALERFEDKKKLESALKRLGSEGRKFGLSLIAINQSSNVDDLGISRPYRNNYLIIALNASARQLAEDKWGRQDERTQLINNTAYSCLVSGSVSPQPAIHLTHSGYSQFKKVGNPPQGLGKINQLPWGIYPWRGNNDDRVNESLEFARNLIKNNPVSPNNINLDKEEINPVDTIKNWVLSRGKKSTTRDVIKNCSIAKKLNYDTPAIEYIFDEMENQKLGRKIKTFIVGGRTSIAFIPNNVEDTGDDGDNADDGDNN